MTRGIVKKILKKSPKSGSVPIFMTANANTQLIQHDIQMDERHTIPSVVIMPAVSPTEACVVRIHASPIQNTHEAHVTRVPFAIDAGV